MNEQTDSNDIAKSHLGFEGMRGWGLFWCGLQDGQCVAEAPEGECKKGSSIKRVDASNRDGLPAVKNCPLVVLPEFCTKTAWNVYIASQAL